MSEYAPTRNEALTLLHSYNRSDNLRTHAYAVEAVMRHIARKRGQDEEKWGVIGLIHDLDYEQFPEQHCTKTRMILEEKGWPVEYVRAVISHGWGMCSDVEPLSDLEKTLYAIDELTGLVAASTLVRPSKSVLDLTVSSVKKKWKDKTFAAGAKREEIEKAAAEFGVELWEHVGNVILAMRRIAPELGLVGNI